MNFDSSIAILDILILFENYFLFNIGYLAIKSFIPNFVCHLGHIHSERLVFK